MDTLNIVNRSLACFKHLASSGLVRFKGNVRSSLPAKATVQLVEMIASSAGGISNPEAIEAYTSVTQS